jgi:peptidoglycan lytic transglycosylase
MRLNYRVYLSLILMILAGCSSITVEGDSAPSGPVDTSSIPDAVPKAETRSKYGNPKSYVVFDKRYYVMNNNRGFNQQGIASWYGKKFHGKRTSSGETYDMYAMTAAHKTLILPAYVEVTNLGNGKKVIVKVNDRGPFHENRIIDLSYSAATKLDVIAKGTALVKLRVVEPGYVSGKDPGKKGAPVETISPDHSPGDFFIQVGAFSDLGNAENLRRKLNTIGNTLVKISQVVIDNRSLYRVRIGPLSNVDNADKIVQQLIQLNEHDHHIVVN